MWRRIYTLDKSSYEMQAYQGIVIRNNHERVELFNFLAGGWSVWRPLAVKSILWKTVWLNRLHFSLAKIISHTASVGVNHRVQVFHKIWFHDMNHTYFYFRENWNGTGRFRDVKKSINVQNPVLNLIVKKKIMLRTKLVNVLQVMNLKLRRSVAVMKAFVDGQNYENALRRLMITNKSQKWRMIFKLCRDMHLMKSLSLK